MENRARQVRVRREIEAIEDSLRARVDCPSSDLLTCQRSHPVDGVGAHGMAHAGETLIGLHRQVVQVSVTLVRVDEQQREANQHTVTAGGDYVSPPPTSVRPLLMLRKRRDAYLLKLSRHSVTWIEYHPLEYQLTYGPPADHFSTVALTSHGGNAPNCGGARD
jgi:hypothetical protein